MESGANKLTWHQKGLAVKSSSSPLEDEAQGRCSHRALLTQEELCVNGHMLQTRSTKAHCGKNQEWLRHEPEFLLFCFSGTREYNPEMKLG